MRAQGSPSARRHSWGAGFLRGHEGPVRRPAPAPPSRGGARAAEAILMGVIERTPGRGSTIPHSTAPTGGSGRAGRSPGAPAPARASLKGRLVAWIREFIQFGMVGATAFVVDWGCSTCCSTGRWGSWPGTPTPRSSAPPPPRPCTRGSPTACGPTAGAPGPALPARPCSSSSPTPAGSASASSACSSRTTSSAWPRRWRTTSRSTSWDSPWAPRSASSSTTTSCSPGSAERADPLRHDVGDASFGRSASTRPRARP